MIDTGLDELRVSLDAADAKSFLAVRGKNFFDRIVRNVRELHRLQREIGADDAARVAVADRAEGDDRAAAGVRAPGGVDGRAGGPSAAAGVRRAGLRPGAAGSRRCSRRCARRSRAAIEDAAALARDLGITLDASGATEPGLSLKRQDDGAALVGVPPAVVADVFHRAWPRAAVLHRAVLRARLRQLHAGRCDAADAARDLERRGVSGFPRGAAQRCAAAPCAECGLRWSLCERSTVEPRRRRHPDAERGRRRSPARSRCFRATWWTRSSSPTAAAATARRRSRRRPVPAW